MDTLEGASPAQPSGRTENAVCWECGERLVCNEYVVCCTGTLFHVCPECEAKLNGSDESPEGTGPAEG
ncbi:hypothetical protein Pan216_16540 [Planctomycetes bacterium Pan216]|uniref:Uncharacterized protein n=1 Tax=Kolteria novifilia TaxID=2527975 RepID=A0A518B1H6_9BACT|nr:hypothetical protein Pan216_16540 [Planctomycetes bacterium Pan216]